MLVPDGLFWVNCYAKRTFPTVNCSQTKYQERNLLPGFVYAFFHKRLYEEIPEKGNDLVSSTKAIVQLLTP